MKDGLFIQRIHQKLDPSKKTDLILGGLIWKYSSLYNGIYTVMYFFEIKKRKLRIHTLYSDCFFSFEIYFKGFLKTSNQLKTV